ncbi:MAG: type II secretion system protein GspD [Desulfobacteraceae bacterium]|jgi:general secretion pathway protein D|nr:MAG: type II secretion system protein GspD [Desulfobacteraceae bacterium]
MTAKETHLWNSTFGRFFLLLFSGMFFLASLGGAAEPGAPGSHGGAGADKAVEKAVTIDFDGVDIVVFIKFISELTGKNFVIDSAVRGNVTIVSPTRISVSEAYKVFESVLDVHGYAAVPAGNIIKILPVAQTRGQNVETRLRESAVSPSDKVVTRIIPLTYANSDELKKILDPLVSKGSIIVSYAPAGMLIVTDLLSNIQRLLKIVEAVDVQGMGEQVSVIPLVHGSAGPMAKSISGLFQDTTRKLKKDAAPEAVIKVFPDERTNSLIVLASETDMAKIKELIRLLDREPPRGEGDIRVYYLQNARAEDLAKVLMAIPVTQAKEQDKSKAPVLSKEVQIVADKSTNSLVITAGKDDYAVLEEVIRKLDIARRMVYIEALIMEVSVTKDFELGVEWRGAEKTGSIDGRQIVTFGASSAQPSGFPGVDRTTQTVTLPLGFSLGVLGEGISIGGLLFPNIGAVIRAYQKDSDVHILSTPQIMTTDNEEAEIQVGKNVPYLTRQDTSQSGIDYSHYEYKDVGVTLQITPQINQERFVRLKISQEVSQVIKEESSVGLPTTLKRLAKTTVIIKDGHTVVIGGLIDETMTAGTYQVPCLGGIPVLGNLFKTSSKSSGKTNLYVFLTPHIVEYAAESDKLYKEKKEQIDKIKEGSIKMYQSPAGR